MFHEILNELITANGQTNIASKLGISDSQLSGFKNGERGLNITAIDRLFELAGVEIVQKNTLSDMERVVVTLASMLKGRQVQ